MTEDEDRRAWKAVAAMPSPSLEDLSIPANATPDEIDQAAQRLLEDCQNADPELTLDDVRLGIQAMLAEARRGWEAGVDPRPSLPVIK